MKRILHAVAVVAAFFPWALGVLGFASALVLVLIADRLWPKATAGNCWSYSGPRWARKGGYLLIRPADDVRVFGLRLIPHAIWVPEVPPELAVRQTYPLKRTNAKLLPWRTLYFPFKVLRKERPHNAENWPTTQPPRG